MEAVPQVPCCLPVWHLDSPQQCDIFNSWLRRICWWFSTTPDPFLCNSFPASCSSYFIYAVDSTCLCEGSCTSPSSISALIPQVAKIIWNSALAAPCAASSLSTCPHLQGGDHWGAATGQLQHHSFDRKADNCLLCRSFEQFHTHTRCHRSLQTALSLLLRISGETGSEDFPKSRHKGFSASSISWSEIGWLTQLFPPRKSIL